MAIMSSRAARPRLTRRPLRYPRAAAVVGATLLVTGCPRAPMPPGLPPQSFEAEPTSDAGTVSGTEAGTAVIAIEPSAETPDAALRAVLSPDGATFPSSVRGAITVEFRNEGSDDEVLRMDVLGVGILSLDVFDARGERIPTIPPPMPPTPEEMENAKETLAPGESRRVEYSLHMFSPPLPVGTYTAKMRDVPSNTVTFEISATP